jgi:hypothetical protein
VDPPNLIKTFEERAKFVSLALSRLYGVTLITGTIIINGFYAIVFNPTLRQDNYNNKEVYDDKYTIMTAHSLLTYLHEYVHYFLRSSQGSYYVSTAE